MIESARICFTAVVVSACIYCMPALEFVCATKRTTSASVCSIISISYALSASRASFNSFSRVWYLTLNFKLLHPQGLNPYTVDPASSSACVMSHTCASIHTQAAEAAEAKRKAEEEANQAKVSIKQSPIPAPAPCPTPSSPPVLQCAGPANAKREIWYLLVLLQCWCLVNHECAVTYTRAREMCLALCVYLCVCACVCIHYIHMYVYM